MPIIKERIKFDNQDVNLKINLGVDNNVSGYQQEIDELTEKTKIDLTNPIVDNEVKRFLYGGGETIYLKFYFTANGTTYVNTFSSTGAKFTSAEISSNSMKIRNSFFIMDFYDSFDDYTQNRIFTIHNTQILNGVGGLPNYEITNDNQFYSWYVPKSFIDQNIANGITEIIGYVKFSFYTAKYGSVRLFYNKDYVNAENPTSPERMYFKVNLDLVNGTWEFNTSGNQKAYQLPITNLYSQKVNDAVDNFDNKQQDYPEGTIFDAETGDYDVE